MLYHSLLVGEWLEKQGQFPEVVLAGLIHDLHEALVGDVSRPLKRLLPAYQEIENKAERFTQKLVQEYTGLFLESAFSSPAIKQADNVLVLTEAKVFMGSTLEGWKRSEEPDSLIVFEELSSRRVQKLFWKCFRAAAGRSKNGLDL